MGVARKKEHIFLREQTVQSLNDQGLDIGRKSEDIHRDQHEFLFFVLEHDRLCPDMIMDSLRRLAHACSVSSQCEFHLQGWSKRYPGSTCAYARLCLFKQQCQQNKNYALKYFLHMSPLLACIVT